MLPCSVFDSFWLKRVVKYTVVGVEVIPTPGISKQSLPVRKDVRGVPPQQFEILWRGQHTLCLGTKQVFFWLLAATICSLLLSTKPLFGRSLNFLIFGLSWAVIVGWAVGFFRARWGSLGLLISLELPYLGGFPGRHPSQPRTAALPSPRSLRPRR